MRAAADTLARKLAALVREHGAPNRFFLAAEAALTAPERAYIRQTCGQALALPDGGSATFVKVPGFPPCWAADVTAPPEVR